MLCPFPAFHRCSRPESLCECPLQTALVPMSTTFLFAAYFASWKASLSNCLVAPHGSTRLDRHLVVVSLWPVPECDPAVAAVDQQFIQFVTARVPCCSSKHVLLIAVDHERVMDVFELASAIHVLLTILTSCPCPGSLARAFSQYRVTLPAVRVPAAPDPFNVSAD